MHHVSDASGQITVTPLLVNLKVNAAFINYTKQKPITVMKAALHSDIGHAGNKGEDKKLDMTLTNLDNMRRKTEVYMSSQRKSFVAGLEKKQGTWIREHQRTATKSNNQAKLRKENRQRVAQEEARKTKEKKRGKIKNYKMKETRRVK